MALYYDAAPLLLPSLDHAGSLKSRVFSPKGHKSPPKQIFALVSEASKWSTVLSEVIEKSQLLQLERKVCPWDPSLAAKILTDTEGIFHVAVSQLRPLTGPRPFAHQARHLCSIVAPFATYCRET